MQFAKWARRRAAIILAPLVAAALSSAASAATASPTPAMPLGSPGSWITTNDYPAVALRYRQQGTVGFVLTIDPSGKVADCTIAASSGTAILDEATCKLLRDRAIFSPATDKKGRPVSGTYSNRTRWILPASVPPTSKITLILALAYGPDGNVEFCRLRETHGPVNALNRAELERRACAQAVSESPKEVFTDANGKPVTHVRTITLVEGFTLRSATNTSVLRISPHALAPVQ
ncbi:energy transducer TonB [Novosphingobium flavum]|uniref:Energy transducer TonB n=1 Tax=Novosphingobium flavum TaxID=1778672 RepID=A0A7X1KN36_9SPHN|nr:energy transducer TonB [Novosphingobium flavum]MBC2667242.1 energy transducer TonB [Novosphingobium flavum]